MLTKINITSIIADHIRTFKAYAHEGMTPKGLQISDFFIFFGMPAIITAIVGYFYGGLTGGVVSMIMTCLAIFAALLFNLLLLTYDLIRRHRSTESNDQWVIRQRLLREVVSNIGFAIVTAMVAICALIVVRFCEGGQIVNLALSCTVYYLAILFFLTILMLLKRIYVLLLREIEGG